ncbi:MAG TPA: hypothetical protein VFQ91_26215 [Bryobacteraceae bacterium]|nr:hypothetical protein [Bryobacteraceae bacterium]
MGYGEVWGSCLGRAGQTDEREVRSRNGMLFRCTVVLFNAEAGPIPYPGEHFSLVLYCELLEHLHPRPRRYAHFDQTQHRLPARGGSPMGGQTSRLVHPILLAPGDSLSDHRHGREYTPAEVMQLLSDAGFTVEKIETGPYGPTEEHPQCPARRRATREGR